MAALFIGAPLRPAVAIDSRLAVILLKCQDRADKISRQNRNPDGA